MTTYNLCFIGFGNVGKSLAQLLLDQSAEMRRRYGIEWKLTGVASRRLGWLADPAGLDVPALLARNPMVEARLPDGEERGWLAAARADALFEMSSLDVVNGQPAISYLE
ncbi:MAG TPA: homoserine dehydrogenase, partial [Chloroflexota bacterium]|nr:homoserine dehydrogenase [Chloroflexota bacterium]